MYSEVAGVLVSSGTQVGPQIALDPDFPFLLTMITRGEQKANNKLKSFYDPATGFSFIFISHVSFFFFSFCFEQGSSFTPFVSHDLAFLTGLMVLLGC